MGSTFRVKRRGTSKTRESLYKQWTRSTWCWGGTKGKEESRDPWSLLSRGGFPAKSTAKSLFNPPELVARTEESSSILGGGEPGETLLSVERISKKKNDVSLERKRGLGGFMEKNKNGGRRNRRKSEWGKKLLGKGFFC